MGRATLALGVLTTVLVGAPAVAAPRHVVLSYVLGEGAGDCPSRAALHEAVGHRLGYVPFVTDGDEHIEVSIQARGSRYRATVRLRRVGEPFNAERLVDASVQGCDELIDALALAVSLALDPEAVDRIKRPRRPRDLDTPKRERRGPVTLLSASVYPSTERAQGGEPSAGQWALGARLGVSWGLTPQIAPEVAISGCYLRSLWALGFELRASAPVPLFVAGGAVTASRVMAGAHVCGGLPWLRGCAVASAGALLLEGEGFESARSEARFMGSGGARLQLTWPLTGSLTFDAVAGLEFPFTAVSTRVGAEVVWRAQAVGVDTSVGLFWRL